MASGPIFEGQEFADYEELKTALDKYQQEQFTVLTKRNSTTVEYANKRVTPGQPKYDEKFVFSSMKFVCKHNGVCRKESKGIRPHQRSFKINCPVEIAVSVDRKRNKLVVSRVNLEHNHEVSSDIYQRYPQVRRVAAEKLLALNKESAKAMELLRPTGSKIITTKDIHNLRTKAGSSETEELRILDELETLLNDDPNTSIRLFVNLKDEIELIFIQTSKMKEYALNFSEVLFVANTYRINNKGMPLSTIMVVDGNGNGQVVGQAILSDERQESLEKFMEAFRDLNPVTKDTKMFIVDRDKNRMAVIKRLWPKAKIFLCLFHVLNVLRGEIHKLPGDAANKEKLCKLCSNLVFAQTENEYSFHYEALQKDNTISDFFEYYTKNWHNSRDMWVAYARKKFVNLGQRTRNILESYHEKLKRSCTSKMTVSQFIHELVKINLRKDEKVDNESFYQQMTVRYVHENQDALAKKLQSLATPYAADAMIANLKQAAKVVYEVVDVDGGNFILIHIAKDEFSTQKQYEVSISRDKVCCTCTFFTDTRLPCHHVFRCPEAVDISNVNWIPNNFRKAGLGCFINKTLPASTYGITVKKIDPKKPLTRTEKFNEMNELLRQISNLSTDLDHEQFLARYELMSKIAQAFAEERQVTVHIGNGDLGNESAEEVNPENGDGNRDDEEVIVKDDVANRYDEKAIVEGNIAYRDDKELIVEERDANKHDEKVIVVDSMDSNRCKSGDKKCTFTITNRDLVTEIKTLDVPKGVKRSVLEGTTKRKQTEEKKDKTIKRKKISAEPGRLAEPEGSADSIVL